MELAGAIPVATNVLNTVMIAMDSSDAELFCPASRTAGPARFKSPIRRTRARRSCANSAWRSPKIRGVRHWEGNVCLQATDEGLTNTSYWKALDGGEIVSTGIHRDVLECDGKLQNYLKANYSHLDHGWRPRRRDVITHS